MRETKLICSFLESLLGDNVVFKNEEDFKSKLFSMVEDGIDNLQFVTDFDETITKHTVDGKSGPSSLEPFFRVKTFSQEYVDRVKVKCSILKPNLYNANLTPDQQLEFDAAVGDVWACSVGEKAAITDIYEAVEQVAFPLKDGCKDFLSSLKELQVPMTVVSAGSGDVIQHVLRDTNAKVVANFMKFQNNLITELAKPAVGMFNKNKVPLPIDGRRSNIVVMGDFAWDSVIADNVPNKKNVLKIGFFYGRNNETIQQYLNYFDVLLVNNETMNFALGILKLVAGNV